MNSTCEFELIKEENILELKTRALLYRHIKTGAQVLSLINDDENKVFGVNFRTPSNDSTGIAHILEHSVLCGSRKYPVKEPFVELIKGSLQTFLNAFTYPDKTCYPAASQNLKDFYNLIDVYLDAVFYPQITPWIFQQEGCHLELENIQDPLVYKGVVFNEMKGAYSSPDRLLMEYSQHSLFPNTPYGVESGGDPKYIPHLTYDEFHRFHQDYYHPSNTRIYFYGDDDPQKRLAIIEEYLKDFERRDIHSSVSVQKPFDMPKHFVKSFPGGEEGGEHPNGMITVNWLLPETTQPEMNLALQILEYILLGMPASPLRKALIESGLGEGLAGVGLEKDLRQMFFSTGLKGIDPQNADRVESLIMSTLDELMNNGIDPQTIEAAINTVEFQLRENNSGGYPQGLVLMLRSLTTWLYDSDPLILLAFERPLQELKAKVKSNKQVFESLIDKYFIKNSHRTTLLLKPDTQLGEKEKEEERKHLAHIRNSMGDTELRDLVENTCKLKEMQKTPDSHTALATIPSLELNDLNRTNKLIPMDLLREGDTRVLYHDLFTNKIIYLDLGLDLHSLPQHYLQYAPVFGRALLEMGSEREDYVKLAQRISTKTGGIHSQPVTSTTKEGKQSVVKLFLRGKAMVPQAGELLKILSDVLLYTLFDNKERFKQIVLEEKAKREQKLVPEGHRIVNLRLKSNFNEADWAAEQMQGISYLFFLRQLLRDIDDDWQSVLNVLEEIRRLLLNKDGMILNVTLDNQAWSRILPLVREFLDRFPRAPMVQEYWQRDESIDFDCLAIPSQVNFVGKGVDIYKLGYRFHGSSLVISHYLRTAWLWDRVRVQGGAYGAFNAFDRFSGILTFISYRDPNIIKTLDVYDQTAEYLKQIHLNEKELTKSIIGVIGSIDQYMLPDAKGYTSLLRHISKDDDMSRQKMREEVLGTTATHFKEFGDLLSNAGNEGLVTVLGAQSSLEESMKDQRDKLRIIKVL
ncbi:MAG: insulinase family protein [Thermodesulfobacteriota bacterium]|nr:insulinase family protein [Thermodesulfobacteriota bacterium]